VTDQRPTRTGPRETPPAGRRAGRLLPLGRFFGVPIYFAPSWLLIAGFLTLYYAPIVNDLVADISASTAYLTSFAFAVAFAFCVLAHELGHTAVSLALGSPVRRIVIFLLGGVSEIERDPRRPRDEFLIAVAGPVVSILIAAITGLGYEALPHGTLSAVFVGLLFWSNLIVAVFNLLPGLPLDGGRLLRAAVWAVSSSRLTGTRIAAWAGRIFAVLLALSGLLVNRESWAFTAGLFSVFLAIYLWFGASQSLRSAEIEERLPSLSIASLLRPGLLVPADISIAEAVRRAVENRVRGLVVVDSAERPQAIVDESLVESIPPDRRPWMPVTDVARALEPGLVLDVGLSGDDLVAAVRATPAHEYLVVDAAGRPAGILSVADLAARLKGAR
jgi:Zn-dependent protease/CBS domain-containing protein